MKKFLKNKMFIEQLKTLNKWDKIVYCDIDGTIYRDSLFLDIINYFINDGLVDNESIERYNYLKSEWKNRNIGYEEFLMYTITWIFEKVLNKINIDYIYNIWYSIIEKNSWKVFVYTLEQLKKYQNNWYKIIFISWSPLELVYLFSKEYEFDIALWSLLSTNNQWTLESDYVLASSQAKIEVVNYINNLYQPSDTIAFWDTSWDYDMLINSSLWYAINPTYELYNKIKDIDNILVIIERKDLILKINKESRKYISYFDNLI